MDLSKIARGLKVASALMEDEGRITPDVILDGFFSGRFSDTKKYFESIHSLIEMNQRDFPDLAQRELVTFPSGKNILQGYLYHKENPKGLILYVHGLKGMADDQYAMGIHEFLVRGYSVFAFDLTCSGRVNRPCAKVFLRKTLETPHLRRLGWPCMVGQSTK